MARGSAYVNPKDYPDWPQMGGIDAAKHFGGGGGGDEGGDGAGRLPPSGKGHAYVSFQKHPGWPQIAIAEGGPVPDIRPNKAGTRNYAKGGTVRR